MIIPEITGLHVFVPEIHKKYATVSPKSKLNAFCTSAHFPDFQAVLKSKMHCFYATAAVYKRAILHGT